VFRGIDFSAAAGRHRAGDEENLAQLGLARIAHKSPAKFGERGLAADTPPCSSRARSTPRSTPFRR